MLPEPVSSSRSPGAWLRSWPAAVRPLLLLAIAAFGSALLASVVAYVRGADATQPWQAVTTLREISVPLDTVRVGLQALPVEAPAFVLTQTVLPALPALPFTAAGLLLVLVAVVLVGYLAILPDLGWKTFLAGTGALLIFLSTLNLDLLNLLPVSLFRQAVLVVALLALGGTAYVVRSFFPLLSLARRLALFAALVGALGTLALTRAGLPGAVTAMHLTQYALAGALAAAAAFILFVSYENIRAILWLAGQADTPARRRGPLAFLLTAGLYLTNLLLVYLNGFGFIKLSGAFLDAFFVLLCSIVSGLIGLRLREAEYGRAVPYLLMLPLYLLLAALTLGTVGFAFATDNDPIIEAFTDWVVATHLAAGFGFTIYVLANFWALLRRRLRAYRVVFDPKIAPLFIAYFLTGLGMATILYPTDLFVFRLASGGYYAGLGDRYRADTPELAEAYYRQSEEKVPANQKATAGRAALAHLANEGQREEAALRQALLRNPTERAYARLAALFDGPEDFFIQQPILWQGLRRFPDSAPLNLLLGARYARTALADSVRFYYARAARNGPSGLVQQALQANELAYALTHGDVPGAVKLAASTLPDGAAAQTNVLLARLLTAARPAPLNLPAQTVADSLTPDAFGLTLARALTQVRAAGSVSAPDTSAAASLAAHAAQPTNTVYTSDLLEARAYVLWAGGQFARARAELLALAQTSPTPALAGRRYRTLAQWALAENQSAQAVEWLERAAQAGDIPAFLFRPLALARARQPDSARRALGPLLAAEDPTVQFPGRYLAGVLTVPGRLLPTDSARADWAVLRGADVKTTTVDSVLAGMRQPGPLAVAVSALTDAALDRGDIRRATELLTRLPTAPPEQLLMRQAAPTLRWLRAETALRSGRLPEATKLLAGPAPTAPFAAGYHHYLTALAAAARDDVNAAQGAFTALPARAPWLTRGLLAAADYFAQHPPKARPLAAYETLLVGVSYTPASVALWQAYALECARQGFSDFGTTALNRLRALQPAPAFATFQATYEATRQALQDGF